MIVVSIDKQKQHIACYEGYRSKPTTYQCYPQTLQESVQDARFKPLFQSIYSPKNDSSPSSGPSVGPSSSSLDPSSPAFAKFTAPNCTLPDLMGCGEATEGDVAVARSDFLSSAGTSSGTSLVGEVATPTALLGISRSGILWLGMVRSP